MTIEGGIDLKEAAEQAEMRVCNFLSLAHPAQITTTSEAVQVATAHALLAISYRLASLQQSLKDGLFFIGDR